MADSTSSAPAATGAPSTGGADASAASSTANDTPHRELSPRQRIKESIREGRKVTASARTDDTGQDDKRQSQRAAGSEKDAGAPSKEQAETLDDKAKEAKKEPDSEVVPLKAFKERLARESEKAKTLRDQLGSKDLELAKSREGIRILNAELERLRAAFQEGRRPDDKDERLRGHELEAEARASLDRIQREHEQKLQAGDNETRIAVAKEELQQEVGDALSRYPMVHQRELMAEVRAAWAANPNARIADIAASIQEAKLATADKLRAPSRPPAPTTARPSSSGSAFTFSNDKRGVKAALAAQRQTGA
jgi:hypothetical protein